MSNEQVPATGDRDVIKPMDKHAPIAAAGVGEQAPAKPVAADGSAPGTVSAKDKHAPLGDPK
ncbi:hypothetical protein [Streptomyces tubercidicus]|uniref:hypothetical protein n=1 Tax=Streptomyces tubercidicus TaxID=47759 RepID=UPI0034666F77